MTLEREKNLKGFTRFQIKILALIFMGALRFLLQFMPQLQRGDGFFPANGILSTFALIYVG